MMRHLIEKGDARTRAWALRAMLKAAHTRGHREALAAVAAGSSAGTKRRTIFDGRHGTTLPGELVRGEGDPPSGDPAVNEAYDGLGATYDFYLDAYERNSIDDKGLRLDATVHYDQDYDNAFWNGSQMVFGDGDGVIFVGFTKAIDVIGHELTHGVTQYTAALDYQDQPGALNESMSDVFGSLVKQHYLKQKADEADWLIGQGILAPGIHGEALRSMKAPGTAYDDPQLGKDPQPANMRNYVKIDDDNGGVHINSGIPNHAFYLAATAIGGYAWEQAGLIWYKTLLRLVHDAQFQDAADATFNAAGELYGAGSSQQSAVRGAWADVGIKVAGATIRGRRQATAAEAGADGYERKLDKLVNELSRLVDVLGKQVEGAGKR
jgi:Zn-dependent metalloprotease